MSKSQNTNTNHPARLGLALMAGGLIAGCGGGDRPWTVDPDGYDGLDEVSFPLLANSCTFPGNSTMALSVRRGETLYVTLRATDNMVIAGAQTAGQAECAVPSTYKIAITEDAVSPAIGSATTEKVFLDYINGPFAVGTTTGQTVTPGITIALATGSSIVVRGSSGADNIYLGSTYTSATPPALVHSWINVSGDTTADVQFDGVTDVKVSTGVGADLISADGGKGTGTALDAAITFSAYGGPDADTLTGGKGPSTLDGGDGDDKFIQTATVGPDDIRGGPGLDTVDYSVRATSVNVTLCSTCSADPGGCIGLNSTCHGNADTAYSGCMSGAVSTRDGCTSGALSTRDGCTSGAVSTRDDCTSGALSTKDGCVSGAVSTRDGCLSGPALTRDGCLSGPTQTKDTCVSDAGTALTACTTGAATNGCVAEAAACVAACSDQTCIDACNATDCVTACTFVHDATVAPCMVTYDGYADPTTGTCMTPYNAYADPTTGTCMTPYNGKVDPTTGSCFTAYNGQVDPTTGSCFTAYNAKVDPTTGSCFTAYNAKVDPTTGSCFTAYNAKVTPVTGSCATTRVGDYSLCDQGQATCQAGATVPFCTVCKQDDGAVGEGDTVGDDVEIVYGGKNGDTLSAFWSPCTTQTTPAKIGCTLKGNEGDDTLIGSAFNDTLDGGAGNDLLQGGLGDDTLIGGGGVDTVSYADRTNPVKVSLDSAHLWTNGTAGQNGEANEKDSIASDIENLTGGAGNDYLRGNSSANIIYGGLGNDTIEGGAGNDSLYGEAGNDLLYGGVGNDRLVGGTGTDTLVGGDGDDFLDSTEGLAAAAADTVIDCDGVNDSAGTPGSSGPSAGTADGLVKDSSDLGALHCDL